MVVEEVVAGVEGVPDEVPDDKIFLFCSLPSRDSLGKLTEKAERRVRDKILKRSQGVLKEEPFVKSVQAVCKDDKAARVLTAGQWRRKLRGKFYRPQSRLPL